MSTSAKIAMNFLKMAYRKISGILRSKKTIIGVLILVGIVFAASRGSASRDKIKIAEVKRDTVRTEVIASGKVASRSESSVHFAVSGKVVWVGVEKGDYVKQGQATASLDKEKYEIVLRQAEQDVVAADAELEKLYDGRRNKTSIESYDEKIARTAAEAKKNKAFDAWKEAQRNLKDTVLISPIAGTVVELDIKSGEEVLYTKTVAKIADTENIYFTAEVDETDIGKIRTGQKARIVLDAFPEEEIGASVDFLNFQGTTTSTEATVFEVDFNLPAEKNFLLGMNGEAQIILDEREDVIVIPVEAVVDGNWVWVKSGAKYEKREVKTGIESDSDVEIISGLNAGEDVVVAGFDQLGKKSLVQKLFGR